jgi:hypothetical protein
MYWSIAEDTNPQKEPFTIATGSEEHDRARQDLRPSPLRETVRMTSKA